MKFTHDMCKELPPAGRARHVKCESSYGHRVKRGAPHAKSAARRAPREARRAKRTLTPRHASPPTRPLEPLVEFRISEFQNLFMVNSTRLRRQHYPAKAYPRPNNCGHQ